MTREEALIILHDEHFAYSKANANDVREAYDMAIKALEQEPCEDAISREPFTDSTICEGFSCNECSFNRIDKGGCILEERVKALPSVTPQERTGYWILADEQNKEDVENDNYRFICSECQCSDIHAKGAKVPYCWKCGAKME